MLPAATHGSPAQVYTCRLCRRVLFSEQELEIHEAAQQSFRRRKVMPRTKSLSSFVLKMIYGYAVCSSSRTTIRKSIR